MLESNSSGFADNVLCNPTGRVRRGELWEVKERLPGTVAFFPLSECQLPGNHGCNSVFCPYPGPWAQQQLVLQRRQFWNDLTEVMC